MNAERDLVFCLARFVACGVQFGGCDVVGGFDFPEFGERLGESSATGDEGASALVQR